jgi:nitroreductase
MEVFDAVRTVLAVRQYQDRPVPDEVIQRIVEAGRLTASSINKQPWHFVAVKDRERVRQLGSLVKSGPYIAQAPVAIAVAYERASRFGVSDASRAIQSMVLVAWEDGIGSNWTGFGGLDEVQRFLEIPDEFEVLAVLPFGYPTTAVGRGRKRRRDLGQIASLERFAVPFR